MKYAYFYLDTLNLSTPYLTYPDDEDSVFIRVSNLKQVDKIINVLINENYDIIDFSSNFKPSDIKDYKKEG